MQNKSGLIRGSVYNFSIYQFSVLVIKIHEDEFSIESSIYEQVLFINRESCCWVDDGSK